MQTVKSDNVKQLEMIITSLAIVCLAVFFYGTRIIIITLLSSLFCYITDIICCKLRKKRVDFKDISPVYTGMVLAMMMPASVSYDIVIFTACFSIIVGKQVFGGRGKNLFVPAAVGYIFAVFSFRDAVTMFPRPDTVLPLTSEISVNLFKALSINSTNVLSSSFNYFNILTGDIIGPWGASQILLLIIIAVILIIRKDICPTVFLSTLLTLIISVFIFDFNTISTSLLIELSSGMTLFSLIFIVCDQYTLPRKSLSRILYGVIIGIVTVFFKKIGNVENPLIYSVIIVNPLRICLDNRSEVIMISIVNIYKKIKDNMIYLKRKFKWKSNVK